MKFFRNFIIVFIIFENPLCCLGDCESPLLDRAVISATSRASENQGPDNARLNSQIAWTAGKSDFGQFLTIDLGEKKNVTSIATQGRPFSSEFVEEYRIEFGNNGYDYAEYKDEEGNIKLFRGNRDGSTIQRNYFETPIIAQWIRINPTRWRDRISLRLELYGCEYVASTISFDGSAFVRHELRYNVIMSIREHIRLRFRTNKADGIILYSKGTQGDLLALQLVDNQLLLNVDLGAKLMTSVSVGSLLDDNLWHDVVINRNRQDLVLTVDRVIVRHKIRGDFTQLDLNTELFLGGVKNFNQEGLVIAENFTGCIENLFINHSNFIAEARYNPGDVYWNTNAVFSCEQESVIPVTFKKPGSFIRMKGYEGVPNVNVGLDFRTFEEHGLLLYHKFAQGYVMLYLEKGFLRLGFQGENYAKVDTEIFNATYSDGRWHRVKLIMSANYSEVNIDDQPSRTITQLSFKTGPFYSLGGGAKQNNLKGFVGCMRLINIDNNSRDPKTIAKYDREGEIMFDSCQMIDRCNPNPCEHGGICQQSWRTFTCDCSSTGYEGAVCHTSQHYLSCEAYHQSDPGRKKVDIVIDVDGSGILKPFPVTCEFPANVPSQTYLGHKNERTITVNGFEKPGSFVQDITYNAEMDQIIELVNRSSHCRQFLSYQCYRARLFNSPVPDRVKFEPLSWWVSRTNQKMDYWGGSLPGSRKCRCGLFAQCVDPNRWCNCDAATNSWNRDEGYLEHMEYLPVRQLRFGDTGSPMDDKQGKYSLGKLICEGDTLFDNTVTFTLPDATINLPRFEWSHSADIYFQFKTTILSATLIHSSGPSDYIKVSLLEGFQIQFSYYAGNGMANPTVSSPVKLNDNRWHSVLIERNRKEARIVVDGSHRKSFQEPIGATRAIQLTSELVIGATVDYQDGYLGCMRALMLNGQPVDLRGMASRGLFGVLPGCVGKCESFPCLNNGTCTELYNDYNCDCRYTAFTGPICADEIGVNMISDYMISYDFEGTYKSTIAEKIRVGFTTTEQKGLLLGLVGRTKEYFNVLLSTSGELKIVFDFGFERQEIVYEDKSLADSQSHDVRISRSNNGLQLNVQIDNQMRNWTYKIEGSQDAQFDNIEKLYIGKNTTMKPGTGFIGCISRVEFDDVYPLQLLFQQDKPANIRADPPTLKKDFCGIQPVEYATELPQTRPPDGDYDAAWAEEGAQPANSAVLGGVLAVIFIALVIMAILIGRYASRHKGEYRTHEDTGAHDAPDADTAIVQGHTGHDVSKKKEWFI
uniref:Neurexin4 n=1 Tax=Hemiscolopendra marginata TaxID=943146 RepID=A0A646QGQ6_9MYRI